MEEIQYIGEHILPGQLGRIALFLSFCASILAAVAYSASTNYRADTELAKSWKKIGRISFWIHGLGVFAIIGTVFYLMINQYYEYQYVQQHVSEDLPMRYIFSAFWEGQEGSFMLWMFWHVILGLILMYAAKSWEAPVLAIFSMVQLVLGSMLLGVYIPFFGEEFKIGANPLLLLREVMDAPIFARADYASVIQGTGLNPLLQNYWMTIHPPTLFLGFASTLVPFAYGIAGLWTRRYKEWLQPVQPWALFSAAILGLGILMGGAWAYEALSFGGYWAWDPVENMSLVPWITLIAGVHTNLIARSTNHSIKSTYLFYCFTFVLVLYSTFLTRSGVLGETSVHAFTEMGLGPQLVALVVIFLAMGLGFYIAHQKRIPVPENEEATASKEFWMFIGTLVLLFSAVLISVSTSLPVYNKIVEFFDPTFVGTVITDQLGHHNRFQLWIGVFVGLLSGMTQFLRFKERNFSGYAKKFGTHLGISVLSAAILTMIAKQWIEANAWQYTLLLFAGIFAITSNLDYLITFLRGNLKTGASALAHIGFGLMIIGILASGLNKEHISTNVFAQSGLIEGFSEDDYKKNISLIKGLPMLMSGYEVTYTGDTLHGFTRTFEINYKKRDKEGNVIEEFNLHPNVLYDKSFTKIAATNPSTKRYVDKDIFTHIASLPKAQISPEFAKEAEDSLSYELYEVGLGDTTFTTRYFVQMKGYTKQPTHPDYKPKENDLAVGLELEFRDLKKDTFFTANPVLVVRENLLYSFPVEINDINVKARLPEAIFTKLFIPDTELNYTEQVLKEGDEFRINGYQITFLGFNPQPKREDYVRQEGDIAVSARLSVLAPNNSEPIIVEPLYLIRNNRPFNLREVIDEEGLFFRFTNISPTDKTITILVAQQALETDKLPVEIAEDYRRTDFIVLEAILFPGINFFWTGTLLMLFGLSLGMWRRRAKKV